MLNFESLTARAKDNGELIILTVEPDGLWTMVPMSHSFLDDEDKAYDWLAEWKRLWLDARVEARKAQDRAKVHRESVIATEFFIATNDERLREIGHRYFRKDLSREDAAAEIVRLGTNWNEAYLCLTAWDNLIAAVSTE